MNFTSGVLGTGRDMSGVRAARAGEETGPRMG